VVCAGVEQYGNISKEKAMLQSIKNWVAQHIQIHLINAMTIPQKLDVVWEEHDAG
jgi:hypothetical protein